MPNTRDFIAVIPTPTCAACLQPLRGRSNFLIVGTEVVHKECAKLGRVTELQRTKADAAGLRGDLARARRAAQECTNHIQRLLLALAQVKGERDTARESLRISDRASEAMVEELSLLRLAQAVGQRRTPEMVAAPADPATPAAPTPDSTPDVRDDTEIRFSLLELDTP